MIMSSHIVARAADAHRQELLATAERHRLARTVVQRSAGSRTGIPHWGKSIRRRKFSEGGELRTAVPVEAPCAS